MTDPPRGTSPTILAVSGSLRRASINSAVLRAAALAAARDGIRVGVADFLSELPPFDPDLEAQPPAAALRFRSACDEAAAVLLAVPEYTFGIPGAFKNALDWVVGSGSLYRKPVTVLKVSPPGRSYCDRDLGGEIGDPRIVAELRSVVVELGRRAGILQPLST